MIKLFASKVFNLSIPEDVNTVSISEAIDQMNAEAEPDVTEGIDINDNNTKDKVLLLSKLCFMVGHVAVKEIVHLEAIESEWKRRKYLGILISFMIREKRIKERC